MLDVSRQAPPWIAWWRRRPTVTTASSPSPNPRRAGRGHAGIWIACVPIGYKADFLWRAQRLIAEADGRDPHTTRLAFEHDRSRDQRLMLAGHHVARFPRRQVFEDPASVETTLRALLARAAYT